MTGIGFRCYWVLLLFFSGVYGLYAQEADVESSALDTGDSAFVLAPGSELYNEVLQIRVVSPKAGSKSSIGSGFQVSDDGLIITNYHVVSGFVQAPNKRKIEYMTHIGESGELELLDFDVINDLAVLRVEEPWEKTFTISPRPLIKGEVVYALGNPYDLGITQVSGPNNGLVDHNYVDKIFFSGSLNPGMSGGPAINKAGEVVGVNVATAGNQISFLVPALAVTKLLERNASLVAENYDAEITTQIKAWQAERIKSLLEEPWAKKDFAGREFPDEIRDDFQCWGGANDEAVDPVVSAISKTCQSKDQIYLSPQLSAGHFHMSFRHEKSERLNGLQFANRRGASMWPNNLSRFKDSTNYRCHADFVKDNQEHDLLTRVTTCVRAFRRFSGLYDSLLLVEQMNNENSWSSHLSISAMTKDQVQALNNKFTEALR